MAIELIENSELGALSKSRLGNGFVDEHYSSFVKPDTFNRCNPSDTECQNKQADAINVQMLNDNATRTEATIKKVKQKWLLDASKGKDCTYIKSRIDDIIKYMSTEYGNHAYDETPEYFNLYIKPLKDVLDIEYANAFKFNNCANKLSGEVSDADSQAEVQRLLAQRKAEREKREAEEKAKRDAEAKVVPSVSTTIADVKSVVSEITNAPSTDNKKLIIGAGIVILVTFILTR
jgi:hypothetical protein